MNIVKIDNRHYFEKRLFCEVDVLSGPDFCLIAASNFDYRD